MTNIDTTYLERCVHTLEEALKFLDRAEKGTIQYKLYRSAAIKEFELIMELSFRLLKKSIKPYFPSSKEVDRLFVKDIFRQAANFNIISADLSEKLMDYRDKRNLVSHDYGEEFADKILSILPDYVKDARLLLKAIQL